MATPRTSRTISSFICQTCRRRTATQTHKRFFTSTSSTLADEQAPTSTDPTSPTTPAPARKSMLSGLAAFGTGTGRGRNASPPTGRNSILGRVESEDEVYGPHRLYVYAHRHNTHLTLVQAPRPASLTAGYTSSKNASDANKMVDVLLSLSAGNIGFRKAGRSSFDAAFQLGGYFFKQIQERGMLRDIEQLEVIVRGFGAGREAVTKVILGPEGRNIRGKITAVMDGTRLKFGGTRSPNPRRLG